jgi:hypothetical protein
MCTQHLHHIHSCPHPPTDTNSPEKTCFALLLSIFVKKKKEKKKRKGIFVKKWYFCLFKIAIHWLPCDIFMYICITTWIGSSRLFFSFLP